VDAVGVSERNGTEDEVPGELEGTARSGAEDEVTDVVIEELEGDIADTERWERAVTKSRFAEDLDSGLR